MDTFRRLFLAQTLAMMAAPRAFAAMPHLILLGDSILDNGSYTGGKPDVIAQVRERLPSGWKASLLAVDGATTQVIPSQLARLPADASHLVLSVGGNDALGSQPVLRAPAKTVAEAMSLLGEAAGTFEANYRKAIGACLARGLPLVTCTIYNGNFPDRQYQRQTATALTAFNDAIIRVGMEHDLTMLDLREICSRPEDYANPIEPSSIGGAKIAQAIVRTVTRPADGLRGARLIGAIH